MSALTTSNIFRYKFDSPIVNLINTFTTTHKYDDASQFRDEWDEFIKDNKASIKCIKVLDITLKINQQKRKKANSDENM